MNLNMVIFYGIDGEQQMFPATLAGVVVTGILSILGLLLYVHVLRRRGPLSARIG